MRRLHYNGFFLCIFHASSWGRQASGSNIHWCWLLMLPQLVLCETVCLCCHLSKCWSYCSSKYCWCCCCCWCWCSCCFSTHHIVVALVELLIIGWFFLILWDACRLWGKWYWWYNQDNQWIIEKSADCWRKLSKVLVDRGSEICSTIPYSFSTVDRRWT